MHPSFAESSRNAAIPIWFVSKTSWPGIREGLTPLARTFVEDRFRCSIEV